MSDMTELDKPIEVDNELRNEIRRISQHSRARRATVSKVMIALCAVALVVSAVPLVLLILQLLEKAYRSSTRHSSRRCRRRRH